MRKVTNYRDKKKSQKVRIRVPVCPYCGSKSVLTSGDMVYQHRPDLHRKMFYVCQPCGARVGCHEDGRPLGTLANRELRLSRLRCHSLFDKLWKSGRMKRKAAYTWLAKFMELPSKDAHIGKFNIEQCNKLIEVLEKMQAD